MHLDQRHLATKWIGVFLAAAFLIQPVSAESSDTGKSVEVDVLGEGAMQVPAEFKQVPPKSRIVQYEFQAKVGDGDQAKTARVTMMQAGGDVKANVRRWKGQFTGGDKKANKTEQFEVGKWTIHIVDINGSFGERMGGGPFAGGKMVQRPGYAMTGAIVVPPDAGPQSGKFFVKMIGPAEVIKANRERLIEMIKTLK